MEALNKILKEEGVRELSESDFREITVEYSAYLAKSYEKLGSSIVDATYGLSGYVAAWEDLDGGAKQFVAPLGGATMCQLGIMKESE